MSKNAEGWIRHRGGKCPVDGEIKVETRQRGGQIVIENAQDFWWEHRSNDGDIMAYKLHKPAEQVAGGIYAADDSVSTEQVAVSYIGESVQGPLQWRDRITTIDFDIHALTTERAELVQKLASEGFALIGRAVEPVEDYGNIQIGDLVSVIGIGGFSDCTGLSVGDIVEVTSVNNDESLKTVSGGSWGSIGYNYKFHSRPSA